MVDHPDDTTDICKNCGAILPYNEKDWPRDILKICPACGFSIKGSSRWGSRKGSLRSEKKNPVLASVLSLVWPGLGQAYNGEYVKAAVIAIVELAGFVYRPIVLVSVLAIIVGMADAYRISKNMNIGNIPFRETRLFNLIVFIIAILVIAVIFFVIAGNHLRIH
jgi:TM2 domain-containing membrane protein YozV